MKRTSAPFKGRVSAAILWIAMTPCLSGAAIAAAPDYPVKPIKMIVPGPPAGATDGIARVIGADISADLTQPVVVENRAGAGGIIGARAVADAPADGYTLLSGHVATNAIVPALVKPKPYDAVTDFTPLALIGTAPDILVVPTASGIKTLADLVALGKRGTPIAFGSPGVGMPQQIEAIELSRRAGVAMSHVPYRGTAPALIDLAGGQITMMFATPAAAAPFLKSGQIRALAIAAPERSKFFPDVPTLKELGYGGVERSVWFGFFAPAKTPPAVVERLGKSIAASLAKPSVRAKLEGLYVEIAKDPSQSAFTTLVKQESARWGSELSAKGISTE
ncbi:MAG: Bug family tripartite tricarboxylate transporter substrate binding protein [Pseudomonadales bacterium]